MAELSARQVAVLRWREIGPAEFAREVLGAEPTDQQLEAGRAIVAKRRVSIRSGHGTGKSAFMAWCVIWFVACHFPCKVPATAPTGHQLSDILWAEIAKWHRVCCERLPAVGAELDWTAERFFRKNSPSEAFAVARTSRPEKPEALQGFHSENLLFLIDEASGVADNVFEVAEGALSTEGAFVVMAANPTRQSGYFFDSHHRMRAHWAPLHWNGEDSPLVSKSYVEQMAKKYGRHSPIFKVRVLGNFVDAADGVISLELCELAKVRDVEVNTNAPIIWGVDVARFGDDSSAICKRRGNHQLAPVREWWGKDTMQTTGIVKQEWDKTPESERPKAINVDVIGIGAGVVDRLKEMQLPVVGVNVAESEAQRTQGDESFNRLRDELWWLGREWLERRDCRLADDEETIGELTTPTYKFLSNGKIQVETKDELRKRGVKSPNRADAFLLTFYDGGLPGVRAAPIKYPKGGIV
jgi:phage terminase large subunit